MKQKNEKKEIEDLICKKEQQNKQISGSMKYGKSKNKKYVTLCRQIRIYIQTWE